MPTKTKTAKGRKGKKLASRILVAQHEAGDVVDVKQDEIFLWTNLGRTARKVSGLRAYLDREDYNVAPGPIGMRPAKVRHNAPLGQHPYSCIPPKRPIDDNPHIIIRSRSVSRRIKKT
jgi:hypothetical protein